MDINIEKHSSFEKQVRGESWKVPREQKQEPQRGRDFGRLQGGKGDKYQVGTANSRVKEREISCIVTYQ